MAKVGLTEPQQWRGALEIWKRRWVSPRYQTIKEADMGVWGAVEKTLGLPPLKEAMQSLRYLAEGQTGQRLDRITARLVKLSGDSQGNAQAMELLRLVERLDQQGTLQRLDGLLKDLQPLIRSKGLNAMLERLDQLAPLLDKLMKEG